MVLTGVGSPPQDAGSRGRLRKPPWRPGNEVENGAWVPEPSPRLFRSRVFFLLSVPVPRGDITFKQAKITLVGWSWSWTAGQGLWGRGAASAGDPLSHPQVLMLSYPHSCTELHACSALLRAQGRGGMCSQRFRVFGSLFYSCQDVSYRRPAASEAAIPSLDLHTRLANPTQEV